MTRPPESPAPALPKRPPGPRTLADDIASIPPGGAPEAVREEDRRRLEQLGGAQPQGGKSAAKR